MLGPDEVALPVTLARAALAQAGNRDAAASTSRTPGGFVVRSLLGADE